MTKYGYSLSLPVPPEKMTPASTTSVRTKVKPMQAAWAIQDDQKLFLSSSVQTTRENATVFSTQVVWKRHSSSMTTEHPKDISVSKLLSSKISYAFLEFLWAFDCLE